MWALLVGWIAGTNARTAHNSALPESVKQTRYDARQQAKAARKLPTKPWAEQGNSAGFRLFVLGMIVVAAVIVAAVLLFG